MISNSNEFWKHPDGLGYRHCLRFNSEYKTVSNEIIKERTTYLMVVVSGGLNQQRNEIVGAVVIARIIEASLVVPVLQVNAIWGDKSEFADIFDLDHFQKVLADDLRIVSLLPSTYLMTSPVLVRGIPFYLTSHQIRICIVEENLHFVLQSIDLIWRFLFESVEENLHFGYKVLFWRYIQIYIYNNRMGKKSCRALKKSKAVDKVASCESNKNKDDHQKILIDGFMSAFDSVTIEEDVAAYKLAEGDENKAAEILMDSAAAAAEEEDKSTTISCSSTGSFALSSRNGSSLESELFSPTDFVGNGAVGRKRKGTSKKKVVGAGTVSKKSSSSRSSPYKSKGEMISDERWRKETEQFLYSMLGVECELSMDVVRDVLCQCAYDVGKALNVLLDLSSSSYYPGHDNVGEL